MSRRSKIDVGRLSSLVSRPGIDPRVWITLAVVLETGFDAQHGVFADVQYLPSGEEQTAHIGGAYAGRDYGLFAPLEKDDVVLVAVPHGDDNYGPVVVARLWANSAKPNALFGGEPDDTAGVPPTTQDVVLRARDGRKVVVRVSHADFDVEVVDGGDVKLVAHGVVKMQDASQAFVRGDDFAAATDTYLDAQTVFLTALSTFFGALNTVLSPVFPPITPPVTTMVAAINVYKTAVAAYKNAKNVYLSTKVKGQ